MTRLCPNPRSTGVSHDAPVEYRRRWYRSALQGGAVLLLALACLIFTQQFHFARLWTGAGDLFRLIFKESMPPDFRNWADWMRPLFDTLMMSVSATAIAVVLSIPLAI